MSTNSNCTIFEYNPNEWYYLLERWNCPRGAWDWREYADCYGPFASDIEANQHLSDNHANPGGYSIITNAQFKADAVYDEAVKATVKPQKPRNYFGIGGRILGRWE